jgi:hypothetical protein
MITFVDFLKHLIGSGTLPCPKRAASRHRRFQVPNRIPVTVRAAGGKLIAQSDRAVLTTELSVGQEN